MDDLATRVYKTITVQRNTAARGYRSGSAVTQHIALGRILEVCDLFELCLAQLSRTKLLELRDALTDVRENTRSELRHERDQLASSITFIEGMITAD